MASGLSREAREQLRRAYGAMLEQAPSVEQIAFHTGAWERASATPFRVPREEIQGTMTGRLYADFGRAPEEPRGDGSTGTNVGRTDGGVTMTPLFADHTVDEYLATRIDAPHYAEERDTVRLAQLAAYREASQQDRHIRENPDYYDHTECGVCQGEGRAGDGARPVTWSRVMDFPEPWPLVLTNPVTRTQWHAALLSSTRKLARRAHLYAAKGVS